MASVKKLRRKVIIAWLEGKRHKALKLRKTLLEKLAKKR